jgi:hypothetical protein
MRPPTDAELHTLPHIMLTSDVWDPSYFNNGFSCDELALDAPFSPTVLDLDPHVTD